MGSQTFTGEPTGGTQSGEKVETADYEYGIVHPGKSGLDWQCFICGKEETNRVSLIRHITAHHGVTEPWYVCRAESCTFRSRSSRSVAAHMNQRCFKIDQPEPLSASAEALDFECDSCGRKFRKKSGLQVHRARAHPSVYNEELSTKESNFKWTEGELHHLARTELKFRTLNVGSINKCIATEIPGRTVQAVTGMRRSIAYQTIRDKVFDQAGYCLEGKLGHAILKTIPGRVPDVPTYQAQSPTGPRESTALAGQKHFSPTKARIEARRNRSLKVRTKEHVNTPFPGKAATDGSGWPDTPPQEATRPVPPRPGHDRETIPRDNPISPRESKNRLQLDSEDSPELFRESSLRGATARWSSSDTSSSSCLLPTLSDFASSDESEEEKGITHPPGPTFNVPPSKLEAFTELQKFLESSHEQPGDIALAEYVRSSLSNEASTWAALLDTWAREFSGPNSRSARPASKSKRPNRRPVKAKNRNGRKAEKYKNCQFSWSRDKSATIKNILAGETFDNQKTDLDSPDIKDIENTYVERLEAGIHTDNEPVSPLPIQWGDEARGRFTSAEVKKALKATKRDTASGPCRWLDWKASMRIGPARWAVVFNLWWVLGSIPSSEKECRSILLFKKGERKEVNNWRPITIANLGNRLYCRLWDQRIRKVVQINERQKAFVPLDGCFENAKLLTETIKHQRKIGKEFNVVFLDLAKAFDTVPHHSIARALDRQNCPHDIKNVILDTYDGARTRFAVDGKTTRMIEIRNGVKQGCPLSPVLFNLVMDELISELQSLKCGIVIDGKRVAVMAFADDLVLLSENHNEMEILLEKTRKFFDKRGLSVNASKCQSMRATPAKNKRTLKLWTNVHRWFAGKPIPSITFDTLAKYLGLSIDHTGNVAIPRSEWRLWLQRLKKAPLKPWQKIDAIKSIVVPKITHQLRLSDAGICQLRELSKELREFFKSVLHLPEWTPTSWIHSSSGGGLPDICSTILAARLKASRKMVNSPDPCVAAAGLPVWERASRDARKLKIPDLDPEGNIKKQAEASRRRQIRKSTNGSALTEMLKAKRSWLWDGTLKGDTMINSIKIVSGTLPTRLNQTRGRPGANKLCRRCNKTAETDLHVLSACPANKDMITKRHNKICEKIEKDLKTSQPKADIWRERTWRVQGIALKPDLTVIEGSTCKFIEVTCPYEKDSETLKRREREKKHKYETYLNPDNLPALKERMVTSAETLSIVIGISGTVGSRTVANLKTLGISKSLRSLQIAALAQSGNIWRTHSRSGIG